MKINILLNDNFFNDHCTYSFAFPIFKSLNFIKDKGVNINFFYSYKEKLFDSDILIIDSRFCGKQKNLSEFIDKINKKKTKNNKIIFADTADNSGQIKVEFLPVVDINWKGQILKKNETYMKPHYGGRLFTNFYNKKFKIKDKNEQYSQPVTDKKLLKKIKVCWNMGLCDHGLYSHIKQKLFSIFKSRFFISNTKRYYKEDKKEHNLSCRIGIKYERETVEFQRKKISSILNKYTNIKKLSRFKYLDEMEQSKCVISPFGWGELCPRDFETFINNGILIKPDMSSFDTWPNWYLPKNNSTSGPTYLPFKWDLSNLEYQINFALDKYQNLKQFAVNGQNLYEKFTVGDHSKELFTERFIKLVKN